MNSRVGGRSGTQIPRLWLCEKPEMARSLAAGLCAALNLKELKGARGAIHLSNGEVVTYLIGHMLSLAPPEHYISADQREKGVWSYLPLLPSAFVKWPKDESRDKTKRTTSKYPPVPPSAGPQLSLLCQLIRSAQTIVNAGDTDKEGQLIMDELLEYAGVDPYGSNVLRMYYSDPALSAIAENIKLLEPNGAPRWRLKSAAAMAREQSDWALGMTASRAWRAVTGLREMAVGRVKTPTLALVVQRDREIEAFKAKDYFVPVITLSDGTEMRWFRRKDAAGKPGFDESGRIIDERLGQQICNAIASGMTGKVSLSETNRIVEKPPLPYSLSVLQSEASRRYGLSLKDVTNAATSLYQNKKMISYIGTDCQYLPTTVLADAKGILQGLTTTHQRLAIGADLNIQSHAFNDGKVEEHFAIIPTGTVAGPLDESERSVFDLICRRFIAQFYPDHEYDRQRLQALFGQDEFSSTAKTVVVEGWKLVEGHQTSDREGADLDDETEARREVRVSAQSSKAAVSQQRGMT